MEPENGLLLRDLLIRIAREFPSRKVNGSHKLLLPTPHQIAWTVGTRPEDRLGAPARMRHTARVSQSCSCLRLCVPLSGDYEPKGQHPGSVSNISTYPPDVDRRLRGLPSASEQDRRPPPTNSSGSQPTGAPQPP